MPGAAYKKGDVIGQKYEVYGVLGAGGFGIVYLVYYHETEGVYALKTFRDEYLADTQTRDRFRKEAGVWVDLGRHPYLVRASFVDEVSGRLFIVMEYIAPDEQGLNSLEGYLRRRPPDLGQSLRWGIQFCCGMEYANSNGIRCHRDIKPANIMISKDKVVKITDFGLAGVLGATVAVPRIRLSIQQGIVGLSGQTMEGTGFGTPTHMPPEQFTDAASCDERSDIYAFGVVLFQMASGGRLPFLAQLPTDDSEAEKARFWREMHGLHDNAPLPMLDTPLFSIIQRCLVKEPGKRYQSFMELRADIKPLLERQTGESIRPPASIGLLTVWELANKGISLDSLGRYEEAIRCHDKALELDPGNARVWNNKGVSLYSLGRYDEAIRCYDKALELDPRTANAWHNKGNSLCCLGRLEEATRCFDKALELDPRNALFWQSKGLSLDSLGRYEEAISCHDKALELDPGNARVWNNKGVSLYSLGRYEEAIRCHDKALELDPGLALAWNDKGLSLSGLDCCEEAIRCYDKALELDPRQVATWSNKGLSLDCLFRYEEAVRCYDEVLQLDPRDADAWCEKGGSLNGLGLHEEMVSILRNKEAIVSRVRYEEAVGCFDKALELDPRKADAWCGKGKAQEKLGRKQDAVRSYRQFIALAPAQCAEQVADAQQRVRELEGE